jgi:hypothetical protein
MNQINPDPLVAATEELQRALNADARARSSQWADDVHAALEVLAAAIQEEVQAAEKSTAMVGNINPDFQNAPGTERHVQTTREQLINLGERVHQLRADLRHAGGHHALDLAQMRPRGQELLDAIAKLRHAMDEYLMKTLNTNPGAGE